MRLASIELSVSSANTQTKPTKPTPSELEDDELMRFTYEIVDAKTGKTQGTVYYYGRDLKRYQWSQKAPWYIRHLQVINQRAPQVAWR